VNFIELSQNAFVMTDCEHQKNFPFFLFKFSRHISYFTTRMLECSCL